jgi:cytosine/adenosine deaminase-related metal-dependent hydrolase
MSNQSSHLLLKNGTALIHGENDKVNAVRTDILISGSKISKIAASISPPPGSEVIDCTDKIISPGFVDTHHHVWQTLLKGRHANQTLMQYLPEGNFTSSLHTAEDTFWGQLAGCLEMIGCGTTSVVDFAHVNYSPEHSRFTCCFWKVCAPTNPITQTIRSFQQPSRPGYAPFFATVPPHE